MEIEYSPTEMEIEYQLTESMEIDEKKKIGENMEKFLASSNVKNLQVESNVFERISFFKDYILGSGAQGDVIKTVFDFLL